MLDSLQLVGIIRQTLFTALEVVAPLLLVAIVVGLTISIFQAVTQIQEMTLTFVPKMVIFVVMLSYIFPWILKIVVKFSIDILVHQWDKVVSLTNYAS